MPKVVLEDETLRDGLQTVSQPFSLKDKERIFRLLVRAGLRRIQVGSFVHPKIVPQMADTDELVGLAVDTDGVLVTGLILNDKGLERALACGLKHLSMSVSVSDAIAAKTPTRPAAEALREMVGLVERAASRGVRVRAGAQCAFGCVYQGAVSEADVLEAAVALSGAGAKEFNLGRHTGMADPLKVRRLVSGVRALLPDIEISLHLHDTRGLGLANMFAGFEAGVEIFDVAAGGLGGCPFVKGAAGNVPTEDAVNMFARLGVDTGVDLPGLCALVEELEGLLGRDLPGRMSRVLRAGGASLRS